MMSCENNTLTVAANNHYAFQFVKTSPMTYLGRDVEILNILSDKMSFKYKVVTAADKQWGVCSDQGLCSGLIGMVARKEADMAISTVARTSQRAKFVNFSTTYHQDGVTIVTRVPGKYKLSNSFIALPLEPRTWLFCFAFLAFVLVCAKLFKWLGYQNHFDSWAIIKMTLQEGTEVNRKDMDVISLILMLTLTLFSGCVYKMYDCGLTANTNNAPVAKPIDTLEDMLKAIRNKRYVISGAEGTSDQEALLSSPAETLMIFAATTKRRGFRPPGTLERAIDMILTQKFAFIWPKTWLKKDLLDMKIPLDLFHFASESVFSIYFSVVFNRDFACKYAVNKWLKALASSGLLKKWEFDKRIDEATKAQEDDENYVTMAELKLPFLFLIASLSVAFLVCVIEAIGSVKQIGRKFNHPASILR